MISHKSFRWPYIYPSVGKIKDNTKNKVISYRRFGGYFYTDIACLIFILVGIICMVSFCVLMIIK